MMKKLVGVSTLALVLLAGCGSQDITETPPETEESAGGEAVYESGVYEVEVEGYNGPITMSVEFSESEITNVTVNAHSETEGIGTEAVNELPDRIVENQSTDVEAVSGATVTSEAIMDGVNQAVDQAAQ